MNYQNTEAKISYLQENIAVDTDRRDGIVYRAAAHLTDGTYLPCVRFLKPDAAMTEAIEAFENARAGKYVVNDSPELGFRLEIRSIVAHGNRVNAYDVARIEPSRFAFAPPVRSQIRGETTMGWTGFCARMRDGRVFGFGTTGSFEFFEMPDGYTPADIIEIINHSYISATGELRSHPLAFLGNPPDYDSAAVHISRPYFDCFIDEL